ncbi:hypothetical protein QTP70_007035 [Hemibagrus guttatus]|uniref:Uncharacterized protein n=1 Tax=Hemibagrus guttatus TaxID=175788 RepID=A0AAE0RIS3_9TELE|nr:hypothetical protein QTP70_007035 [Hemibagrus guttatus]
MGLLIAVAGFSANVRCSFHTSRGCAFLEWASAVWDADPLKWASCYHFEEGIREVFEHPAALIDSGAAVNLIDGALVEELGISTSPCAPSLRITTIDSQPIGEGYLKCQTELLGFQMGLFHHERLTFYVTSSPVNPVILRFPWLRRHDPQISCRTGELTCWSPACLKNCLRNPVSRSCGTCSVKEVNTEAHGHLPQPYADFERVFNEERASRLPEHQGWDCAIALLPNTSLPKGRIYPLSLPESKAMEDYIEGALAAGHIRPSTSPAAAGFFFIEKKDGGLCLCVDYRGLNAITVRYPYPLPLGTGAAAWGPGVHQARPPERLQPGPYPGERRVEDGVPHDAWTL